MLTRQPAVTWRQMPRFLLAEPKSLAAQGPSHVHSLRDRIRNDVPLVPKM